MCGPGNSLEDFETAMDFALHSDFENDPSDDPPDEPVTDTTNPPDDDEDKCY